MGALIEWHFHLGIPYHTPKIYLDICLNEYSSRLGFPPKVGIVRWPTFAFQLPISPSISIWIDLIIMASVKSNTILLSQFVNHWQPLAPPNNRLHCRKKECTNQHQNNVPWHYSLPFSSDFIRFLVYSSNCSWNVLGSWFIYSSRSRAAVDQHTASVL